MPEIRISDATLSSVLIIQRVYVLLYFLIKPLIAGMNPGIYTNGITLNGAL